MERKTITVHAVTVHIYTIVIVLLLLLLGVLGAKYFHLKLAVNGFTRSTIWMNQQNKPTGQISDYGLSIGRSVQYVSSADLQNYITALSRDLSRDIVVVDIEQKILAATIISNKGRIYNGTDDFVRMTIEDGKVRNFEEKSVDYPAGIIQVVAPMKNSKGETVGAVLVTNSQVAR